MNPDRRMVIMLIIGLLPLFLLFLPIPGTGMQIKDFADKLATDKGIVVEGCSLIMTSVLLSLGIIASKKTPARYTIHGNRKAVSSAGGRRQFNVVDAITVGITQCFAAVFPGLSRSGSTLSVGLMRGINRQTALDYSFVIGIPSIMAAAVLEFKDAVNEPMTIGMAPIIAGIVSSAIVGFLAIKLLKWMVTTNKLHVFVAYTFILGAIVIILGIIEHSTGVNPITGMTINF